MWHGTPRESPGRSLRLPDRREERSKPDGLTTKRGGRELPGVPEVTGRVAVHPLTDRQMPSTDQFLDTPATDLRQRLTAKQLAFRDQVKVETVHARRARGEYPGAKFEGRSWRFPPDCVWTAPTDPADAVTASSAADALAELRAWRAA